MLIALALWFSMKAVVALVQMTKDKGEMTPSQDCRKVGLISLIITIIEVALVAGAIL